VRSAVSKKISVRQFVGSYKDVFESEPGKIVLADLVKRFRVMRPFPLKKENDAIFCEGQRQVVLYILSMLDYDLSQIDELKQNYSTEVKYE
jgi:hypothetical protein